MKGELLHVANYKVVIFDVDGTLYNQRKLRAVMLIRLMVFYFFHPIRVFELRALSIFRKERESKAKQQGEDISENQYKWCSEKSGKSVEQIKKIVDRWIYTEPQKYLRYCKFKNINTFLNVLKKANIVTCVYSDYKAEDKLKALGIEIDNIYSSEQAEINTLKPNPKGLLYIVEQLKVQNENVLFIGDRDEFDGQCARNAGIDYLILNRRRASGFYKKLAYEFYRARE